MKNVSQSSSRGLGAQLLSELEQVLQVLFFPSLRVREEERVAQTLLVDLGQEGLLDRRAELETAARLLLDAGVALL
jgi:hypothetical protein